MCCGSAPAISMTMALAFLVGWACGAQDPGPPQPASSANHNGILQQEFSDEFNGQALDTAKWDNDVADWGVWSWEPENAWVENGCLNLRMQHREHERKGKKLFYTSGIVKSKASPIRYGYFEARIKAAPRFPGVSPDFWVYRGEKDIWTEIDFVEITQHDKNIKLMDTNIHVFRSPELPNGRKNLHEHREWKAPWDPREAFHTYGCKWDDAQIRWYIDGQLVASRTNEFWHQSLDVVLSCGVRPPLHTQPSPNGFPTVCQVDYVRVWKESAPQRDAGVGK